MILQWNRDFIWPPPPPPPPPHFCLLPLPCDPTQESLTYSLLPPAPLRPLHGPLFSLDLVLDQLGAHYSCHLTSFQPYLVDIFDRGILPHMPHHRERKYGGVWRGVCTQVLLSTARQACWLVVSYWRWLLPESHTYGTLRLISVTVSSTTFLQCQLHDGHTSSAHSQTLLMWEYSCTGKSLGTYIHLCIKGVSHDRHIVP